MVQELAAPNGESLKTCCMHPGASSNFRCWPDLCNSSCLFNEIWNCLLCIYEHDKPNEAFVSSVTECVLILSLDVYLDLLSLWFLLPLCLFYFSFPEYNTFSNALKRCRSQKKDNSLFSQRTDEASAAQYFQVTKLQCKFVKSKLLLFA